MKITRKDFLNGLAWTAGSAALPGWEGSAAEAMAQMATDYYPPLRTGLNRWPQGDGRPGLSWPLPRRANRKASTAARRVGDTVQPLDRTTLRRR